MCALRAVDLAPFFVVGRYYAYNHDDRAVLVQVTGFDGTGHVQFRSWPDNGRLPVSYLPSHHLTARKYLVPLWYSNKVVAKVASIGDESIPGGEWMLTGPGAIYVEPDSNQVFFVGPERGPGLPGGKPWIQILADWRVGSPSRIWDYVKLVNGGERQYVVPLSEED